MAKRTGSSASSEGVRGITIFWFVTVMHDFLEPEGDIAFPTGPEVGQEFILRSDGKKARVVSIEPDKLALTAELVE